MALVNGGINLTNIAPINEYKLDNMAPVNGYKLDKSGPSQWVIVVGKMALVNGLE